MTDGTARASQTGAQGPDAVSAVLVVPGEMAARIDRLPPTRVQWELALITQVTWGVILSTDGQAARLYPFIWKPAHVVTSFQYSVVYAFQVGIGILIGDYVMGWLADRIGRKPTMMISAVLAGLFIWPFAFVTSYPALIVLSIFACLGVGGILATNVVYMTEVVGPQVRGKITLGSQTVAVLILFSVLGGLVPHFMFPADYRQYLFLLAGLQLLLLPLIAWRLPESPRWLEARGQGDKARRIVERLEERVRRHAGELPEPDLTPREVVSQTPGVFAVFAPEYRWRTLMLLLVWVLGYGGIVYGFGAYGLVFLVSRGYSASFVFGLATVVGFIGAALLGVNALIGERIERRTAIIFGAVLFALELGRAVQLPRHRGHRDLLHHGVHRRGPVAVEHVRLHGQQLPDADARPGYGLERRARPHRRLGRLHHLRVDIPGLGAAGLDPAHHHPRRARAGGDHRDARDAPAAGRPGKDVEVAGQPRAGRPEVAGAPATGRRRCPSDMVVTSLPKQRQ